MRALWILAFSRVGGAAYLPLMTSMPLHPMATRWTKMIENDEWLLRRAYKLGPR